MPEMQGNHWPAQPLTSCPEPAGQGERFEVKQTNRLNTIPGRAQGGSRYPNEYFTKSLKFAKEKNDVDYIERIKEQLEMIKTVI